MKITSKPFFLFLTYLVSDNCYLYIQFSYHDEQDGMDDEMFQAFEEFLRMPKNKSKPK